jgi:hypothetical protein
MRASVEQEMFVSDESKQSIFERFTKLIVPLVATIGVFFQQKQRTVALGLVAVAVISLLVAVMPLWLALAWWLAR